MATSSGMRTPSTASEATRWGQLVFGIICMVMIANLQYGWTLFVGPIDQKYHWGRAAIQVAFTIFVLTETWLVPIEGYLIDKFGPRIMISASGVLVAIAWVINSIADSLFLLVCRRGDRRHRSRRDLRWLGRQRAEMVPRSAWPGRGFDGSWLRRRLGADGHPDCQHDPVERIRIRVPVVRSRTGHRGRRLSRWCCARRRLARSPHLRLRLSSRRGAITVRPRLSRRRYSGSCMRCSSWSEPAA